MQDRIGQKSPKIRSAYEANMPGCEKNRWQFILKISIFRAGLCSAIACKVAGSKYGGYGQNNQEIALNEDDVLCTGYSRGAGLQAVPVGCPGRVQGRERRQDQALDRGEPGLRRQAFRPAADYSRETKNTHLLGRRR